MPLFSIEYYNWPTILKSEWKLCVSFKETGWWIETRVYLENEFEIFMSDEFENEFEREKDFYAWYTEFSFEWRFENQIYSGTRGWDGKIVMGS